MAPATQPLFAQAEGEGGIVIAPAEQTPVPTEEASGGTASGREVVQRIPVFANGQQVATLVVMSGAGAATPASENGDRFLDRMRLALLVGGIGALVIALILGVVLVDGITRPLRRLRDAARQIAGGDFSQRVAVTSPLEAAELADSFNWMTETLERDRETRRRLLSDIVHELRSPLSVIQGTSQGFLDGVIPADPEHAAVIRDEAALLGKLITDLRDLALAEAGELRLERKPIDVAELVSQAVGVLLPRARESGVEVEGAAPPGLPHCLVDRDRTLQIVGNLLDNALRHTPRGGRIAVRIRQAPEGMLSLDVADTGEGIAPEHLPHIFDRFYRVDAARARGGGTGLGLAIVKQLVEAQGGVATVESAPGRGSVFTVTFPVAEAIDSTSRRVHPLALGDHVPAGIVEIGRRSPCVVAPESDRWTRRRPSLNHRRPTEFRRSFPVVVLVHRARQLRDRLRLVQLVRQHRDDVHGLRRVDDPHIVRGVRPVRRLVRHLRPLRQQRRQPVR